ncbi:HDOD domain-containing protein [Niveibacterium sp. 24ML]|uniref:HDOD domain-containing protein n=1 Tax=Niveibacterium sp. 24ML TaxID=2985512 RepID=UPI00226EDADC|nr:HDOD domain-containing protein [Niveibacterium sp. 24ML]MCX9157887.1 HDOD domain-containing protein [Niveibacterium sp. 24ML]
MDTAQSQRQMLGQEIERELADGSLSFPTFLEVSQKIQQTLEREDAGLDALVPLIMLEPVLAARVVGLANSALFASSNGPVKDVKSAVMRIGLAAVRSLALAVATAQLAQGEQMGGARRLATLLWDHTLDVASWSYAIGATFRTVRPDEAMLAGLLHDIGQFYLIGKAADYPSLLDSESELSDLLLCWHRPVGEAVLRALGMSPELADAVNDRELYGSMWPPATLPDVLMVASLLADTPNPLTHMSEDARVSLRNVVAHGIPEDVLEQLHLDAAEERRKALNALRV